jgi:hypothetical protein
MGVSVSRGRRTCREPVRLRRRLLTGVALVGGVLALGWLGDAGSAVPLDLGVAETVEPVLRAPSFADPLVRRRLAELGGFPHDARLTRFTPFTVHTSITDPPHAVGFVSGYDLTYEPDGAVAPLEYLRAHAGTVAETRCVQEGPLRDPRISPSAQRTCVRYHITFALRVTAVHRRWRPWPAAALARLFAGLMPPRFPAAASIETGCARSADVPARRVMDSIAEPLALKGPLQRAGAVARSGRRRASRARCASDLGVAVSRDRVAVFSRSQPYRDS